MSVRHRQLDDDVWLIEVDGRLDQGQTPAVESELMALLDQGHHRLVVDFSGVTYVNSGGLRCLVSVWRQARLEGGDVTLCGLNPRVLQVFKTVGFDKVFNIFDSCQAAQAALKES